MRLKALKARAASTVARRGQNQPLDRNLREQPDVNRALRECWVGSCRVIANARPSPIVLVLTEDSMQQMWVEHLARWSYCYEPVLLEKIGRALDKERKLAAWQLEYLKDLKNTGDDLRNFFQLFSVTHQVPKPVQSLVKMVGQLRDQVRLGALKRARKQARELLELLAKPGKIHWPKLRVDPAAMRRFLRERIARMKQLAAREKIPALDFHQIKKEFRLLFSVYYCLYPKEAARPGKRNVFSATKNIIKRMNHVLLERKYKEEFRYRNTLIALPEAFRAHLLRFLRSVGITTRAGRRPRWAGSVRGAGRPEAG